MALKVAINGFGRIGRNVLRAIIESGRTDIEVVAINDLADAGRQRPAAEARFGARHRSTADISVDGDDMIVNGKRIRVTAERDPAKLPHAEMGVDIAMECTGFFTDAAKAGGHLTAGAKRVLISAPGKGVDLTVVYGVNHDKLTAEHKIVSNAIVHHQLPGAGRHGARSRVRHRQGPDDDHPRLYQRPEDPRPDPRRSAPRPRRRDVDDPDDDRRRPRGRRSAAAAEGQARRLGRPRADAECQPCRPDLRKRQADHQGRGQRGAQGRRRMAS